ncbi:MAG: class I tRNA ligase family protein, partial [bacterium]
MQFTQKNFEGKIPAIPATHVDGEHEQLLGASVTNGLIAVAKNLDDYRFRDAATEAMNIARAANKYFNDKAPWKSIKDNPEDCAATMNICLQTINTLAVVFAPFCPQAAEQMQTMLGRATCAGTPGRGLVGTDVWMNA